ncbi:MAG: ParB/RepB/Spo0J family partition protein [Acidithiobacillus sp.]
MDTTNNWKELEEDMRLLAAAQGNDKNVEHVLHLIPLTQVDTDPNSPRKFIEQHLYLLNSLIGLRNSILEHGVLQPILVEPKGDRFQIVIGTRRYLAASAAHRLLIHEPGTPHREGIDFSVIPVLLFSPGCRRLEVQLTENVCRAGLQNEELGAAVRDLITQYGGNIGSVARALGTNSKIVEGLMGLAPRRPTKG